ncbi:hypothetical protein [Streptomyces sp. YKOK-I1]
MSFFAPVAALQTQGSVLTDKYAEGYPEKRYYDGCAHVDTIEQLAIDRGTALLLTGGTEVHLVLVDLRDSSLDGRQAEDRLHAVGITVHRNAVPFDPRPPMVSSGLRIGTPALATRGFGEAEFREVADIIAHTLKPEQLPAEQAGALRGRVARLAAAFPLYPELNGAAA